MVQLAVFVSGIHNKTMLTVLLIWQATARLRSAATCIEKELQLALHVSLTTARPLHPHGDTCIARHAWF